VTVGEAGLAGEYDQWRRRLERRNSRTHGWLESWRVLPALRRMRGLGRLARNLAVGAGLPLLAVIGALILFPLVREGSTTACGALEALRLRRAEGPAAAAMPGSRLPAPVRCTVAYWRRL
jgi:hypothetical protein